MTPNLDDPWDWDIDRIVQELCTKHRTWTSLTSVPKLPNPVQLEAKLREGEISGVELLTVPDEDLIQDLDVKVLAHKACFKHALSQFRRRSRKLHGYLNDSEEDSAQLGTIPTPSGQDSTRHAQEAAEAQAAAAVHAVGAAELLHRNSVNNEPATSLQLLADEDPSRKKRRIAPITLSRDVDRDAIRTIPTQADVILKSSPFLHQPQPPRLDHPPDGGIATDLSGPLLKSYLGAEALTRMDIIDVSSLNKDASEPNHEFTLHRSPDMLRGRQLQVHRLFKRSCLKRPGLSVKNDQQTRIIRAGKAQADSVPGYDDPAHDEVISVTFNESDDSMEYDDETWEEILAEQEEAKRLQEAAAKGPSSSVLSDDEVNAAIDEEIREFISHWEERKLPKLDKQAYKIWTAARKARAVGLRQAIKKVQSDIDRFELRITNGRNYILKEKWRTKREVATQTQSLELSVLDKQTAVWTRNLLNTPLEPPKQQGTSNAGSRRVKKQHMVHYDEEEDVDVLTSDSEESFDGFIVSDEELAAAGNHEDASYNASETDDQHLMDVDEEIQGHDAIAQQPAAEMHDTERTDQMELDSQPDMYDLTRVEEPTAEISTPSRASVKVALDSNELKTPDDKKTRAVMQDGEQSSAGPKVRIRIGSGIKNTPLPAYKKMTPFQQMVYNKLCDTDHHYRSIMFAQTLELEPAALWHDFIIAALNRPIVWKPPFANASEKDSYIACFWIQCFDAFTDGVLHRLKHYENLDAEAKQGIKNKAPRFAEFFNFVRSIARRTAKNDEQKKENTVARTPVFLDVEEDTEKLNMDLDNEYPDLPETEAAETPSRRRKPRRDQAAVQLRSSQKKRMAEQDERRKALQAKIAMGSSQITTDMAQFLINDTKEDGQGAIYVHESIRPRIKDHQVAGVRFMWNQIIADSTGRSGCLLAHTMGLGKTMQIITLLIAIGDAAASKDPSISTQIPQELRESRSLILVPPTLVKNWIDELHTWTSKDHSLGQFFSIESATLPEMRGEYVEEWGASGGILVMGYGLFKKMIEDAEVQRVLTETPNIVIADEAHYLKNPNSQVHSSTQNFRTQNRLALTGSPLANNVEEYHSLINWAAPNFLADLAEFRQDFARPIVEGLARDSLPSQKRLALQRLQALRKTVEPKVHRATLAILKDEIPPKMEFIISVPLTTLQRDLYISFMNEQRKTVTDMEGQISSNTQLFAVLTTLSLLCTHPVCYMKKLEPKQGSTGNKATQPEEDPSEFQLPPQQRSNELARLRAQKDLTDVRQSWKIVILMKILDESRELDDKVLIFSQSIPTLDYLESIFRLQKRSILRLDGNTPVGGRQKLVNDFNRSQTNIFLISTTAGGIGLNIVGANRVVIFDFKFNPQHEQQAIGRAYRIGQQKPVFVYRFVCTGSFEEKLQDRAVFKMQLASRVVDRRNPIPRARNLDELLTPPADPPQAKDLDEYQGKDVILDKILQSDEHRNGVRSLLMTDTFEEEAFEDYMLTPEDRREADALVQKQRARMAGQSVDAVSTVNSPALPLPTLNGDITNKPPPAVPRVTKPSTIARPQHESTRVGDTSRSSDLDPSVENERVGQESVGVALPVAGTHTHSREEQSRVSKPQPSTGDVLDSKACQSELIQAFQATEINGFDEEKRRRVAQDINTALWNSADARDEAVQAAAARAIIDVAKYPRFVEAACSQILDIQGLARLTADQIQTMRQNFDHLDEARWKDKLHPRSPEGDPALQLEKSLRKSSTPKESKTLSGGQAHHRTDQEAMQAVRDRREARQGYLPGWARDELAQRGSSSSSSSSSRQRNLSSAHVSHQPPAAPVAAPSASAPLMSASTGSRDPPIASSQGPSPVVPKKKKKLPFL